MCAQITEVQVQVTQNTTALKEANTLLSETRRRYQTMDIELQSELSLVRQSFTTCLHHKVTMAFRGAHLHPCFFFKHILTSIATAMLPFSTIFNIFNVAQVLQVVCGICLKYKKQIY